MLRTLDTLEERSEYGTDSIAAFQRIGPVRLMVVHNGDPRLAALDALLRDLGYDAVVVDTADAARAVIDLEGPPDVLITTQHLGDTIRGPVFARECLARYPQMRALYVSWMPWTRHLPLVQRERVLPAPFTAAGLAAAIAVRRLPARANVKPNRDR